MRLGFVAPASAVRAPARVLDGVGKWSKRRVSANEPRRVHVAPCASAAGLEKSSSTAAPAATTQATSPAQVFTFQEALLALQQYWASRGCILWHPYNTEVGAGTMNPATFLRVLGPEPWSVAYDEPSVRPDDSRYGENPNRVQRHTQFQVILKPAPENPQELLLGSYAALGIDTTAHDIRFVEDNWESPALGAWGLGWEVWLDGMEITQFTYFQQAGGSPLDKVAVEITYGLERIIMSLQQKNHFKNIDFTRDVSYGEIFMQNEVEMSKYNLDQASVPLNSKLFDLYEEEAAQLLSNRLPVPAYNYLLKASHTFNILDARGAIGVTERARYFQRMRTLARNVASLWVERREELGHPLLRQFPDTPARTPTDKVVLESKDTLLLEIGTEELPAAAVDAAVGQMKKSFTSMLERYGLGYSTLAVEATPRRLVTKIDDLAPRQADRKRSARGPPKKAVFDKDGNPSKAALGFCRSQGVDIADVEFRPDDKGTEYLYATVEDKGRELADILAEEVPKVLDGLAFGRTMRWNDTKVTFSRPIRWILALFGETVVPISYGNVHSSSRSCGLRDGTGIAHAINISSAHEYQEAVKAMGVSLAIMDRKKAIMDQVKKSATEIGGFIPDSFINMNDSDCLLAEVTNLVEAPIAIRGEFDEAYLKLPSEILITVMKKHQRYFPVVESGSGNLINSFITVGNGPLSEDVVRAGNEAVLRARYADAVFFYEKDCQTPLADFVPGLAGLAFQERLGSMLDKQNRLTELGPKIAAMLNLGDDEQACLEQALPLAKADLTTSVVVEMTSLAGQMGRHYAEKSGLSSKAAQGIFEHVLPRSSGDELPKSKAGIVIALSDRLDSLVGLFGVGLAPKATADPFGLRRAALGIVQTLVSQGIPFDLRKGISEASKIQPIPVDSEIETLVLDFIVRRMEAWLVEVGDHRIDVIRAALARQGWNPAGSVSCANELEGLYDTPVFADALACHGRALRLVRSKMAVIGEWEVEPALFEVEEEKELYTALEKSTLAADSSASVESVIRNLADLKPILDRYLDNVFVMAEDEKVQKNRLKLCALVAALPEASFDATQIQQM